MESRPMPWSAVAAMCALLIATACVLTSQSVALAADGAIQLLCVLDTGNVCGQDARILGAWAHQGAVVVAANAGATDTYFLTLVLGAAQLVLPAVAWSLAIALSRRDGLVCAAVAMTAALSTAATWYVSVSEIVLAVPLTVLVAVLLWRSQPWRWGDVGLAVVASTVLVASYETALLTGAVLAVWAAWRAGRSTHLPERVGCALVAALSLLSVVVAVSGTGTGPNPTHSQSFLYFVVSLEPWWFYGALFGVATVTAALGPWLEGATRPITLGLGCGVLIVAVVGFEPDAVSAFQARGAAAVAGFVLELFLWWRWTRARDSAVEARAVPRGETRLLVVLPVLFGIAMVAVNLQPLRSWSRSVDAFRTAVDSSEGMVDVADVVPENRREVVWGWTSTSLSLLLRGDPNAAILFDRDPYFVPFPPSEARAHLPDEYTWGG